MAKSELNNIKTYIETLNDPSITFISAINQGLVVPPNMYTAQQKLQPMPTTQQTYDSYNNLNKTPSNYMTPRKKT
tara:strand:+ start:1284 stop:1508 length:225 start_codon:yes stop_codon:yes gene_type:complete